MKTRKRGNSGTILIRARRQKNMEYDMVCEVTGQKESDGCEIQLHHIDGNSKNSELNNLIFLEKNVHLLVHRGSWENTPIQITEASKEEIRKMIMTKKDQINFYADEIISCLENNKDFVINESPIQWKSVIGSVVNRIQEEMRAGTIPFSKIELINELQNRMLDNPRLIHGAARIEAYIQKNIVKNPRENFSNSKQQLNLFDQENQIDFYSDIKNAMKALGSEYKLRFDKTPGVYITL